MSKVIINLIGYAGAGKSTIGEYLISQYGFWLYRPSDTLRTYAADHGIELTGRKDYVEANRRMAEEDPEAIIRPIIESKEKRILIDGLRNPIPYINLRDNYGAKMVYLDCPIETRLARLQFDTTRSGHRSPTDLAALKADEAPDEFNENRNLSNLKEMRELADYVVDATGTFEAEYNRIKPVIEKILQESERTQAAASQS
jgi:dephospho-CoA kinase